MKILAAFLLLPLALLAADPARPAKISARATNIFAVTGMTCEGCAGGLHSELSGTKGVLSATVTLTNQQAVVVFDTNAVNTTGLLKVIAEAGFKAKLK